MCSTLALFFYSSLVIAAVIIKDAMHQKKKRGWLNNCKFWISEVSLHSSSTCDLVTWTKFLHAAHKVINCSMTRTLNTQELAHLWLQNYYTKGQCWEFEKDPSCWIIYNKLNVFLIRTLHSVYLNPMDTERKIYYN